MTDLATPYFPSTTFLAPLSDSDALGEATPWRGILAVEPDIAVLQVKSQLLTEANYCVTPASSDRELFLLRGTKAVALAMLSDRLGERLMRIVARTVRRQWPQTRILILGQVSPTLEDYLYDEQICRSADSREVLAELERLYKGMWNRRSHRIDWDAQKSAGIYGRGPISESDPTKSFPPSPADLRVFHDAPSEIPVPAMRRN